MIGWNQRFISHFSETTAILFDLVHKKDPFVWEEVHQKSFEAIKNSISESTMLRYFEKGRETALFVDAGKKAHKTGNRGGMSAILAQKYQDGWRAIHFASRRLTEVETRWDKTELEARAVKALGERQKYLENIWKEHQNS